MNGVQLDTPRVFFSDEQPSTQLEVHL